jgi:hypothetical protein
MWMEYEFVGFLNSVWNVLLARNKLEDASASSLFGMAEDRTRKGGTGAHTATR